MVRYELGVTISIAMLAKIGDLSPGERGMNGLNVSGEVVTAGTALAGLILIYIGSLVTAYGGYGATEQKSVKLRFLARAWIVFVGFILALLSAALAVLGKWLNSPCASDVSVWILLAAFVWAVFATVQAIREIA